MRTLVGLLLATSLFAETKWMELPNAQLEIDGLPWFGENHGEFYRLPERLKDTFRPPVWGLAKSPSGGRIRFRTDSPVIQIRVEYPKPPDMRNMHAFGQSGIDLYADGVYASSAISDKEAKPDKVYEHKFFDLSKRPRVMRDIVVYLPLYMPAKVLSIGLEDDAKVEKAKPFAVAKPVVFYGTSITQGGCASRSGMSYQAILGRKLNLDFVNLGFSGNGKGEPEVAKAVAELDPSVFVLDFSANNESVESVRAVYAPFVETLRAKHPDTPIVCISLIATSGEVYNDQTRLLRRGMREVISGVVKSRIAAGDSHISFIDGTDLLGFSQLDGVVDGTHPNDLGFQWMADGISSRLREILHLTSP